MHINLQMMRDHLSKFKEIRFQDVEIDGVPLVIVHYMVWNNNLLDEPLSLEARGAVFRADTGECICRPFEKFFNIGEQSFTQKNQLQLLPWNTATVTKKRDGSLLTPVLVRGNIHWKSKKSFSSDLVKDFLSSGLPIEMYNHMVTGLLLKGLTPIFEYTSRQFRIIIDYGIEPTLTLIAVRNNVTGEYIECPNAAATWFGFNVIDTVPVDLDDILSMQDTVENEEGWVVHFDHSIRVKFKTKWYLARHRILDLRERDVADAVVGETIDDIYPMIQECGYDTNVIRNIQKSVSAELVAIDEQIHRMYVNVKDLSRRDIAKSDRVSKELLPGVFCRIDHDSDKLESFERKVWAERYRKNYSLLSVANPKFGNKE